MPSPVVNLVGCALCGLSVGIMWPGSFSKASHALPRGGTAMYAFLALGGALTFKNARHSVEVVETVDEKWLLTETDCPYMAPEPVRGTRNEPANIPYILARMASVRNESVEHMADVVMANDERYLHG